jgi:hypothetical protein
MKEIFSGSQARVLQALAVNLRNTGYERLKKCYIFPFFERANSLVIIYYPNFSHSKTNSIQFEFEFQWEIQIEFINSSIYKTRPIIQNYLRDNKITHWKNIFDNKKITIRKLLIQF